jgi:hypothetical protein
MATSSPTRDLSVSVRLSVAEAEALVKGVFTCTSAVRWHEAERALALISVAVAERLQGRE